MNKKVVMANLGMVFITMIWGITFVMVKDALNDAPPFTFLALRKGLAFAVGVIYLNKHIKKITTYFDLSDPAFRGIFGSSQRRRRR